MLPEHDWNFYVSNIELSAKDAITEVVQDYAGDVAFYNGELDAEDLRDALSALAPRFPLFLPGYVNGKDIWEHRTSPEIGAPWVVRHEFGFLVVCADNNPQGDSERRLGTYRMVSDVHRALSGRQLYKDDVLLNGGELKQETVELIANLPDMAARAVPFAGHFRYLSPDRRPEALLMNRAEATFERLAWPDRGTGNTPGVEIQIRR